MHLYTNCNHTCVRKVPLTMSISFYLKLYVLTIPIFFIIDILWLGVFAKGFYRRNLGAILSPDVNWAAAVTFYLIYIAGILFFAVRPAVANSSLGQDVSEAVSQGNLPDHGLYEFEASQF